MDDAGIVEGLDSLHDASEEVQFFSEAGEVVSDVERERIWNILHV